MKPLDPDLLRHTSAARGYVILTAALGFVTSGLVLAQAVLLAAVLAPVITANATLTDVRVPLIALACVAVARAGVAALQTRFAHRAATRVIAGLRRDLLTRALALGPRWLTAPTESGTRASDLHTLTTRGLEDLRPYIINYLPQLLLTATVTPVALVLVFGLDIISGLIIAGTIPLVPLFMILVGTLTQTSSQRRLVTMSRLGAQVLDLLTGLATLRSFGRERGPAARVRALGEAYTRSTMTTLRVAFLSGMVLELLTTLSVALVAVAMGLRLVYGQVGLEAALAVIILAPEVHLPLRQVGQHFHASTNGIAAWERAKAVLDEPVRPPGQVCLSGHGDVRIDVRDVSVGSPERAVDAPAGVSFSVEPGVITALRGPSGSGKSTAVLVALGLVTPTSGRVTVTQGGVTTDMPDVEVGTLWRHVAWLNQRSPLPPASLAEILGVADHTPERVQQALAASGLDTVVAGLAAGLDTRVGYGGVGLSVGQRQRVHVARTLLSDAGVVVLDEPTAHLDAATEETVMAAMKDLRDAGRAVLVVAHRPSLLSLADRVVDVRSSVWERSPV